MCVSVKGGSRKRQTKSDGVLSNEHTVELRSRIQKLVGMWADEEQMKGNKVFYWNIMSGEQMTEIAAKVPTTPDELAECLVPEHFQKEYGDRLLSVINAYIDSENLHEIIERRPRKKLKRKMPEHPSLLSAKHTDELRSRIQKLVGMWADEEQMNGNIVFYWNIMNSEQMKEIAAKVPTTPDELSECLVPEHFQKEYGDRLLESINAYIDSEDLQDQVFL